MSYEDDELVEERSFRTSDEDEDDMMEPMEEMTDFGLDEEDPDKDS